MGDVADMMREGILCEVCGVFIGDAVDYPRLCSDCAKDRRAAGHVVDRNGPAFIDWGKNPPPGIKIACHVCGRRVKSVGLKDHLRDAHP